MPDPAPIVTRATAPGSPFEIVVEEILGVPTQVYGQRMRSMRELVAQSASRAEAPWLVQGARRFTFGEHDAAARGVAHRELGEEVKAVVQLRDRSTATADDIRGFCRLHLADFKVPAYVEICSEPLPRNPAGNVLKSMLRGGVTSFAAADDSAL